MDMISKLYRSCFIILVLSFVPLSASAAVDFSKLKMNSFYGAYIDSNKIGYAEDKFEIVENDGRKTIVFTSKFYFEIGVIARPEIGVSEYSFESEFDLVSREMLNVYEKSKEIIYNSKEDLINKNEDKVEISSIRADYLGDSSYKVIESEGNSIKEKRLSLPPLLIDNFFADVDFVQNYKEDKSEIRVDVSDLYFDEERVVPAEIKFLRTHEYIRENKSFKHFELEIHQDNTIFTSVHDAKGNLIRGNFYGIDLKLEPEEIAKSLDSERYISVLFSYPLNEAIPTEKIINNLELKIFGSSLKDYLVENERQEILEQTDKFILARLSRGNKLKEPDEQTSVTQFLKATTKYNWKNESLHSINPTNDLAGLTVEDKVKALLDFTSNFIEYEFTLGASLQEIIDQKLGDCTEYAQLFISLARLNGIPARKVSGLAYNYIDDNPMFYGHAWAEVWINGRWKEVDPGWNEFHIDATHIKLTDDYFSDVEFFIAENIELSGYD